MKKLVSLVLSMALLLMCAAAFAENDFLGEWYLKTVTSGDQSMDVAAMGITGTMVLEESGRATVAFVGEETVGSWQADENGNLVITMEDSPATAIVTDTELKLVSDEMEMVFTREQAEGIVLADRNPAASAEDFNGTWKCAYASVAGITMDANALISQATDGDEGIPIMTMKDGVLSMDGEDITGLGTENIEMEYKDGAYLYSMDFEGFTISFETYMLQDGMLCFSVDMGEQINLYFTRVEDVAAEPAA